VFRAVLRTVLYGVLWCRAVLCGAVRRFTVSYRALRCHTVPYGVVRCRTVLGPSVSPFVARSLCGVESARDVQSAPPPSASRHVQRKGAASLSGAEEQTARAPLAAMRSAPA